MGTTCWSTSWLSIFSPACRRRTPNGTGSAECLARIPQIPTNSRIAETCGIAGGLVVDRPAENSAAVVEGPLPLISCRGTLG
jgi:hypothetical protein